MKPIKVIAYLGPSGSKLYRAEQIFKYLNRTGEFQCVVSPNYPNDAELLWADIIFLQHTVDPRVIADCWAYKLERGKKIVIDRDDALVVTDDNPFKKRNAQYHAPSWTIELMKIADLITVTTQPLYEESIPYNKNVHILPNYLDMELWDVGTTPNETGRIRLGWAGSMTHRADLNLVFPVVKKLLLTYPHVKFLYCGDATLGKELTDMPVGSYEYIQAIGDVHQYAAYAQRTFSYDIAIAPLVDNHFNRCKSFLKYLEYGMMKCPGVYSPAAYEGTIKHAVTGFLAKDLDEWEYNLTQLIENEEMRKLIGMNAYLDVKQHYSMVDHVEDWAKLYRGLLTQNPAMVA